MDAYTLTTPQRRHHWSSGLTLMCWMMAAVPITATAAPPKVHPGGLRYRDSAPPSITRAGKATLSARALVGKGGETTIDVSTSTLDTAAPAPGNISKLQLKAVDAGGRLRDLHNYNHLNSGGRVQLLAGGLGRGLTLRLQAHVEGPGSPRTEVVSLETKVRRRPDLAVQQLSAPERASAGTPIMVSALVEELNGDTGSEADCVLRVDGAEVDRAPGIWVDAAGAVSCAFTYAFPRAGRHTLSVELADMVPGDDEPSNNEAKASVHVEDWLGYHHEATADSGAWRTVSRLEGWLTRSSSGSFKRSEWFSDYENSGWQQTVQFRGELPSEIRFPLTRFSLAHAVGGEALPGTTFEGLQPEAGASCVWAADPASGGNLTLCAQGGRTHFTYSRYGGEVTYFSYWYQATWFTDTRTGTTSFSDWTINSGGHLSWGTERWTEGSTYDFDVQLVDGPARYRATALVALEPYEERIELPYTCTAYSSASYSSETCTRSEYTLQGVRGTSVSGEL